MNIQTVMDEVAEALRSIGPLAGRTYPWNAARVTPPAAVVDLPERVEYDLAYGRGSDKVTLSVMVVVGPPADRSTGERLTEYLSGSGALSVKAAVEGRVYGACDHVTVTEAEVLVASFANVQYMAVQFTVEAVGKGGA